MTLADYLDAEKFPLTTQAGLSPSNQLFLDAFKYDGMQEELESGKACDEHWQAVWAELQEKVKHHARLTAEVTARAKRGAGLP